MLFARTCFLVAFMLLSFVNFAQSKLAYAYDHEVLSFYGENRFMRNGEILKRKQIEPLLRNCTASSGEYKAYKKHRRIAAALQIGMGVFYASTIGLAAFNTGAALGTFGLGFGASVAALPMRLEAKKHLQSAVFLYNKQVVLNSVHENN